jgi:hypothetical protein
VLVAGRVVSGKKGIGVLLVLFSLFLSWLACCLERLRLLLCLDEFFVVTWGI